MDQPGHRLDLRIPTVPIFSVFRIRFGRESGKTVEKTFFSALHYFGSTRVPRELGKVPQIGLDIRIPTIPTFPVFQIRFGCKSGKTVFLFCSIVEKQQKKMVFPFSLIVAQPPHL